MSGPTALLRSRLKTKELRGVYAAGSSGDERPSRHRSSGFELKLGLRSIEDTVVFDEEEVTEKILQDHIKETTRGIDLIHNHYKTARRLSQQRRTLSADKKTRRYRRCRSHLCREIIRTSLVIRDLGIAPLERKRLSERVNHTTNLMGSLGRQLA
jgi:hypothetical protein